MAEGIIVIDKPRDWTSMDVCAKLRGAFHEKRIGHAGTLDPMATGVLPVFVGRATRAVEFAAGGQQEYVVGLKLGVVTDTQDTTGTVLEERPLPPDAWERLAGLLGRFTGEIEQIPPMYSALKVHGKKLYDLARQGVEVERKARRVTIFSLEAARDGSAWDAETAGLEGSGLFFLRVRCSKGTYMRTLCHDIGRALGCGGCMSYLRRTEAAGFSVGEAIPLRQVLTAEDPALLLWPVDALFAPYPALTLQADEERRFRNGAAALPCSGAAEGTYRLYGAGGAFLALVQVEKGRASAIKRFFPPENER